MIEITLHNIAYYDSVVFIDNNIEVSISGHALQGRKGEDIVCAALSTLSQTLVLAIAKIATVNQNVDQNNGFLKTAFSVEKLKVETKRDLAVLFEYFIIGIVEIKKQYNDIIEILYTR